MLPEITVIGNLKKIETKYIPSGKQVTKFQIECSEKNAKGEYENLYLTGEVWEKASEFLTKYFTEGNSAIVTGKLVTKSYSKADGTKVYENKLLFPNVHFVPRDKASKDIKQMEPMEYRAGNNASGGQSYQDHMKQDPSMNQEVPEIDIDDDEIPFSRG
jgi:single-strand DNA-binding protein